MEPQEIPELFELLLRRYTTSPEDDTVETVPPPPAKELFDYLKTTDERAAASKGVEHFVHFARQFLLEHLPQAHLTAVQGFGIELALVGPVRLVPAANEEPAGDMEPSHDVPVTHGTGGSRTVLSNSVPITGAQPS